MSKGPCTTCPVYDVLNRIGWALPDFDLTRLKEKPGDELYGFDALHACGSRTESEQTLKRAVIETCFIFWVRVLVWVKPSLVHSYTPFFPGSLPHLQEFAHGEHGPSEQAIVEHEFLCQLLSLVPEFVFTTLAMQTPHLSNQDAPQLRLCLDGRCAPTDALNSFVKSADVSFIAG
jgi:hypothetical protein